MVKSDTLALFYLLQGYNNNNKNLLGIIQDIFSFQKACMEKKGFGFSLNTLLV